ncbi:hypothetical protein SAMN04244553_1940 [Nocardia amikacinitolerans]|uniref:Uncharacterized protein n=2 Tax=Nocardia amikacinitolerans TaxID=756689 RepID=A0A285L634_9NOCA|nr:hypothetical protein SAMN04244553_1940 [Nocardia amikacinitolerans]
MKRGFTAVGRVVANCCHCDQPFGPLGGKPCEFSSIDEAMDFFVDGADGWELYGDRLMCPDCLPLSRCFNPGHDWHTSIGVIASGETLVTRQCTLCGLYIAEVLA